MFIDDHGVKAPSAGVKEYFGSCGGAGGQSFCRKTVSEIRVTAIVAPAGGLLHAGYAACFFSPIPWWLAGDASFSAGRTSSVLPDSTRTGLTTSSKPGDGLTSLAWGAARKCAPWCR
jgi:hypothetical protein